VYQQPKRPQLSPVLLLFLFYTPKVLYQLLHLQQLLSHYGDVVVKHPVPSPPQSQALLLLFAFLSYIKEESL
jgi:hypothetical protein